ncbi:MAG: molybdopterin molybdotransferase MoeA [Verrucomicrobiota bacterium]|nr:molybdopterin molybdotransferase MoeA [Verrucomicrobiota bacterium]
MITEAEALAQIMESVEPLASSAVALAQARERFAARDLFARIALPGFDNSAMDGYAVVASSCETGKTLRVIGEQSAGLDRKLRIVAGEAVRIFTGAPLPDGADAVVMQEDVQREGAAVFVNTKVESGEFVRRRGSDLSVGQKILEAGERIRPQTLALLASQGLAEVDVGGEVRASIVTTGDELVAPGRSLEAGQIYESNSALLQALCEKWGASDATVEHSPDEAQTLEAALRRGIERDVLIIVGGVSVGARDLVKPVLNAVGARTDLWRVSVKPGKPFLFGRAGPCAIFGLPGNPVSAFVTFLLFVRPAILRMMGARANELPLRSSEAHLAEEVRNPGDRPHYVRGLVGQGTFTATGRQESHALYGLSRANALLRVSPEEILPRGAKVSVLALD